MEAKTWHTTDKSGWGPGPWQEEPDKEQWPDPVTGYACLLKRGPSGALCGYVGVPEGHPWHSRDHDDIAADVHGGLTYSSSCEEGPEGETICHVPAPGEPEPLWWVGFDCAHAFDIIPAVIWPNVPYPGESYKAVAYVKRECAALAAQAATAGTAGK